MSFSVCFCQLCIVKETRSFPRNWAGRKLIFFLLKPRSKIVKLFFYYWKIFKNSKNSCTNAKFRLLCRCMIDDQQLTSTLWIFVRSFSYRSQNWYLQRYMVLHIDARHRQHLTGIVSDFVNGQYQEILYLEIHENDPWRLYKYGLEKKAFVKLLHSSAETNSKIKSKLRFKALPFRPCNHFSLKPNL